MICPICHRCPYVKGVCEDRVNRGRRYFLMGALALPVARKLEALAPAPAAALHMNEIYRYDGAGRWVRTGEILPGVAHVSFSLDTGWALAT